MIWDLLIDLNRVIVGSSLNVVNVAYADDKVNALKLKQWRKLDRLQYAAGFLNQCLLRLVHIKLIVFYSCRKKVRCILHELNARWQRSRTCVSPIKTQITIFFCCGITCDAPNCQIVPRTIITPRRQSYTRVLKMGQNIKALFLVCLSSSGYWIISSE